MGRIGIILFLLVFWNLENFFDYRDGGGGDSDREFSAAGERHWTKKRFQAKCNAVSKGIMWIADEVGEIPDVVCVAEVENSFVLRRLLETTALQKLDYRIVHFDSPDSRGIDCALLYRESALELVSARPCRVTGVSPDGTDTLRTRDILLAQFVRKEGADAVSSAGPDSLAILVNHHPSKYGGEGSEWRREAAVSRLAALADSLQRARWRDIVACGDFNDTPPTPLYRTLCPPFVNLALRDAPRGEGSIRFNGLWETIDLCFVTEPLASRGHYSIVHIPFLTTRDTVHGGEKPLRTYSGPRYFGGVSDHRPILFQL